MLEGLPGGLPALQPYQDIAGVWTDGYGNTHGVVPFKHISPEQAESDLDMNLTAAATVVDSSVKVQLNPNERDALILFVLNEGSEAFDTSTLLRLLNAGNYDAVPNQLDRWDKFHDPATGAIKTSTGLQARRATEKTIWLTPASVDYDVPSAAKARTHDSGTAALPPAPSNVLQTSTGMQSATAAATATAGVVIEAVNSVKPVSDAIHTGVDMASGLPPFLSMLVVVALIAVVCVSLKTLHDRHKKLQENGQ